MATRIVFGVMSATQPAELVDQLADLLYPHPVVVHHDFRKLADYAPSARNVTLIPDPRNTGWGSWGLADGVFHTVRALETATVFFEAKAGPYVPVSAEEKAPWAPAEGEAAVADYLAGLRQACLGAAA